MLGSDIFTFDFSSQSSFLTSSDLPKKNDVNNLLSLCQDISSLKRVGAKTISRLKKLKIFSLLDLISHIPRGYLDLSNLRNISDLKEGEFVTVMGDIKDAQASYARRGRQVLRVAVFDSTGYLFCIWFNQNYLKEKFSCGSKFAFSGRIKRRGMQLQMINPFYEELVDEDLSEVEANVKVVPLYSLTGGLYVKLLRRMISALFDMVAFVPDFIPMGTCTESKIPVISLLRRIHFPLDMDEIDELKRELKYIELFFLSFALLLKKSYFKDRFHERGRPLMVMNFISDVDLPFKLTKSQEDAVNQILSDMSGKLPMNRLLHGEVGAGKTIVALLSCLAVKRAGAQSALMVPTELLARQHYNSIKNLIPELSECSALLMSSMPRAERIRILDMVSDGKIGLLVGTHSLISEDVVFKDLALVIIDEQHRFGVQQRLMLKNKGVVPHMLIMSATPIPRSVTQTIYGDLDVTRIEVKEDRQRNIITRIFTDTERRDVYKQVLEILKKAGKLFVVCPLVDESEKIEARSVKAEANRLRNDAFKDFNISVVYSALPSEEKIRAMEDFNSGRSQIIVATTVIEVGIDISEANVMIIEGADRFGLAQLHQLRGRIGRAGQESFCFIALNEYGPLRSGERLINFSRIIDGFELAKMDLANRGEGELFGERQTGIPELKIASILNDEDILQVAKADAEKIFFESRDSAATELMSRLTRFIYREKRFWNIA
jgi:ATP-dependent DNA helicase RecG